MGEPVKQCAGEPLGTEDFGPFLESQVSGHHKAMMLIGPADNLKKQFGSGLGEGNIFESIDRKVMEYLELVPPGL